MIIKNAVSKSTSTDRVEVVLKDVSDNSVTVDFVKGTLLGTDFDIEEDFVIDCTPGAHPKIINVFLTRNKATDEFSNMIDEVVEDGVDQAFNWFQPNLSFTMVYHLLSINIPVTGEPSLTKMGIEEFVEPVQTSPNRGPNNA